MMSKEEVMAWHEDHGNFAKMVIDLNGPEISDVIFIDDGLDGVVYRNAQTGITSNEIEDVIRPDKRFIVAEESEKALEGFYAVENKELEIVIIATAAFRKDENGKYAWHKTRKTFISKEHLPYGSMFTYGDDICGQALINPKNGKWVNHMNASRKAALEHFGGPIGYMYSGKPGDFNFFTFSTAFAFEDASRDFGDYMRFLNNNIKIGAIFYMKPDYRGGICEFVYDKMPAPDEALKAMKEYALNGCKNYAKDYMRVSILQKVDGVLLHRIFLLYVHVEHPFENTTVEIFETNRVEINGYYDEQARHNALSPVVWRGDLKDTPFEYVVDVIDESIKTSFKKTLPNTDADKLMQNFIDKFGIDEIELVDTLTLIGANKVLEPILRLNCKNAGKFKRKIWQGIITEGWTYNVGYYLNNNFNGCDRDETNLDKIFFLPKGMFHYTVENNMDDYINTVKKIFRTTNAAYEYFLRLNDADWKYLINSVAKMEKSPIGASYMEFFLELLIKLKGHKNWKGYYAFLEKMSPNDADTYRMYLNAINIIGEDAESAEWKLKGEALRRSYVALAEVIHMNSMKDADKIRENYQTFSNEWKKFLFEDDVFTIIYPKAPEELVAEGIFLNHCVKGFIRNVGEGLTNILFIRRKNKKDKPFYTLEIRDNKIRQCHGHNNKNATKEVEEFLKKFCKEKDIKFDAGNALLAE